MKSDRRESKKQQQIATPDISVVIPAYDEEGNIAPLFLALEVVFSHLQLSWELIFCDDGSTDNTWREISNLCGDDSNVCGIKLTRNFGHQYALLAGISFATGKAVITMDADGQHPPEVLPELIDSWTRGSKIVQTIRKDTKSVGLFKKLTSRYYYKIYSFLSGVDIEPGMADFRLLDRQVVDDLLTFREEGLFLRGLVRWVGYPSENIVFEACERNIGETKFTFRKMVNFAWTGITSFSIVPLRLGIFIGLITSVLAFFGMFYAVWAHFFSDNVVAGWASALSITSFLFGVLFILLGIIGDYIGRILKEVKRRPRYLVSDTIGPRSAEWVKNEQQRNR